MKIHHSRINKAQDRRLQLDLRPGMMVQEEARSEMAEQVEDDVRDNGG